MKRTRKGRMVGESKNTGIEGYMSSEGSYPLNRPFFQKFDGGEFDGSAHYISILLETYHDDYVVLLSSAVEGYPCMFRQLWDSHRDEFDLAEVEVNEATRQQLYEHRQRGVRVDGLVGPCGNRRDMHLYVLRGPLNVVNSVVKKFVDSMIEALSGVGGDDDYFDYFPGGVAVLRQCCKALDLEEDYRRFYTAAMNYYRDLEPETIPTWEE